LKKIIVIASLAVISTPCLAKTKVYGEMHASFDKVFVVGEKSRDDFSLNESFLGFKGSTEIRKDVSFIYQFVWGVNSDSFDNNEGLGFGNRNQVIGIASPKGAAIIGRFDTPFKTIGKKVDLFWHTQLGQNRNVTNAKNWDLRADKIIVLQSPIKNGFQGSVAYASDIADTSRITDNASAISLNGIYKKNKYEFAIAYENHDLDSLPGSRKAIRLSTSYKNGPYKWVGFWQKENNNTEVTNEADALVFGIGASYRKGKGIFKAQYYKRDIEDLNQDSNLIAIGYDHLISRNLNLYFQAVKITNPNNLSRTEFGEINSAADQARGISLGVRYKF